MTPDQLIKQVIELGGAIVCSCDASDTEIAFAQKEERFAVDRNGIGFIRRPAEWLALQKQREQSKPAEMLAVLKLHHEWHQTYDEHGGYPESHLCEQTIDAMKLAATS